MLPVITLGIAAAAIGACDRSTAPVVAAVGGQPAITSAITLTIAPNQVTLQAGQTTQLSTNAGTSQQGQVQWASSNTTVAIVSATGLVTAITPGATTITARLSFDTTRVATATVIVTSP